jgi:hypothetical protein
VGAAAACQWFVCESARPIPAGEELLWVYNSSRHDAGYLNSYGFVPCDGTSQPSAVALEESEQQKDSDAAAGRQRLAGLEVALERIGWLAPDQQQKAHGAKTLLSREAEALRSALPSESNPT